MDATTERKGHPLEGVGPGTTLDGRYTTQRRIEQRHGCERWTADDTTLGRSVVVLCLPDADHRASAVLDAARRVAGLDTPTLHRVLDVGRENGVAWVVEADLAESRSLARLVEEGGIPADEVRRIVGEVATALESARHRGLHHLDLRPEDVLRTLDGEVRLRGVATSAAIVGLDDVESEEASRRDAVGVVSLTYAGLTGLWPGATATSLGSAPQVLGGVAAPSEIAAGVPRDLDALCRLTLGDDQGPTSPGDFARQIAPWPSRQVAGKSTIATTAAVDPRVAPVNAGAREPRRGASAPPAAATPAAPAPGVPEHELVEVYEDDSPTRVLDRSASSASSGSATSATPATEVIPVDRSVEDTTVPRRDLASTQALTPVPPRRDGRPAADTATHDAATLDRATQDRAEPGAAAPGGAHAAETGGAHAAPPAASGPSAAASAAAAAAAAGAAMAGAGSAVAGALSRVGSKVGAASRQVGTRAAEKAAERRGFHERITAPNAPGLTAEGERVRPGTGTDAILEAPAPLVPAEPLTKDESKLALGIVAGFLVIALIIGIWGVSRIGSETDLDFGGVPDRTGSSATSGTASGTPSGSASSPAPGAGKGEPLQILAADGFDPQGDGRENGTRAPRVFDGDPSTTWQSEGYATAALGGLKKGVGVSVDLGPNVAAREVTLTLANRADVSVYISASKSLDEATKVGDKADADGKVTFPVKEGTAGQYVIVWFTRLTEDDNGRYRAILGEVEVKN